MTLNLPQRCWRRRADCEPFGAVDAPPDGITEDQFLATDYDPFSFVCCGCVAEEKRTIPQDAYRVCWKTPVVDEMGDYDEQDLTHLMLTVSQALAVVATRRVNGGTVSVPTRQGEFAPGMPWERSAEAQVPTAQGAGEATSSG